MERRPSCHTVAALAMLVLALDGLVAAGAPRVHKAQRVGDGALPHNMTVFIDGDTGKPASVQTQARASFDDRRLVLDIECSEPAMPKLRAKATGKDAYVFDDDCVEIFISPTGSQKLYYHFAANAAGARFDEKVRDRAWNAPWTAKAERKADRWTLQVAIPFAALGSKPETGAMWWINVDRQRRAGGSLQLSSWSPTGKNFHSIAHCGRLVFDNKYAACLTRAVIEPWQRRIPALVARAKIDAAATAQLLQSVDAPRKAIGAIRKAIDAPGRLSMRQFATLLGQGEAALAALDAAEKQLDASIARLESIQAMRKLAAPGQPLLAYGVRAVTNRKLLPAPTPPKSPSRRLRLRACRGEYEPASFVVYPLERAVTLDVVATDLKGPQGVVPASAVDIRAVKRWYQSGEGGRFPINRRQRILTPELLLKDDALVRVDHDKKENYVRLAFPDGTRKWLWVSNTKPSPSEDDVSVEAQPIRDAATLQPVAIARHTAKQFWVTLHVPRTARAGTYRGSIELRAQGRKLDALTVALEVLPFDLEPNPLESSIYFHWGITLDVMGKGTVRHRTRSVVQYKAELANLLAHGIDNPTLGVRYETGLLGLALWLRQQVGMRHDHLYYLIAGAHTPPDTIRRIIGTAKRFGFQDVYFYGRDEARGDKLKAQRPTWQRVHKAGGKVFVAGSRGHNFPAVGDLQDLLVCYGDPTKEEAGLWHDKGHKIFCYANPQSGIEEPETYRRNFGLLLDANNYDGGMTYIYYHGWNDFHGSRYRQHNFVYPTVDGVIDTVQWEGYREGIDDLRYLATLRKAIRAARHAGPTHVRIAGQAQTWLDAMDVTGDLYPIRKQLIDWTLQLIAAKN